MANLKSSQMLFLDDVFRMSGGYVLNFSDRTFGTFFLEEVGIDIDNPRYSVCGGSKGKRLRYFFQNESPPTVIKAIKSLWEHRSALMERDSQIETIANIETKIAAVVASLGGIWEGPTAPSVSPQSIVLPRSKITDFSNSLLELAAMAPHPRGYAFERFLIDLFNAYQLEARDPFRIRGEQIDGSFQLDGATYLLEAKWQNTKSDASELRNFNGKLEEKAAWARGLFVSYSGFTADGLFAFGRAKRLICLDGLDLYDSLRLGIPLDKVLRDKARKAVETGSPFVPVAHL